MRIRHAEPADYTPIIEVVNDWWGGRAVRDIIPRLFFIHFRDTSFIAERRGRRVGFLCGFLSQTYPDEAYIHAVGVHPDFRRRGIGGSLYETFFNAVRPHRRTVVRSLTSPENNLSIAFHTAMGFDVQYPDPADADASPRVQFTKRLAE